MAYVPQADDPFSGGEKIPSLSWKDLPVGSTFTVEILEPAKAIQSRDFETGELAFWDTDKQQPKMSAVINVHVLAGPHSIGEDRSIWAQIPSNILMAMKEAQKAAEARIETGGILHLKFTGTKPHENKRYSPIKQYVCKYEPPASTPQHDPFAEQAKPAAPAQPATAQHQATPQRPATAGRPRF
jgi:hypothetical protein